jgi:hypothetical protein
MHVLLAKLQIIFSEPESIISHSVSSFLIKRFSSLYRARPSVCAAGLIITSAGSTIGVIRSLSLRSPSGRLPQDV